MTSLSIPATQKPRFLEWVKTELIFYTQSSAAVELESGSPLKTVKYILVALYWVLRLICFAGNASSGACLVGPCVRPLGPAGLSTSPLSLGLFDSSAGLHWAFSNTPQRPLLMSFRPSREVCEDGAYEHSSQGDWHGFLWLYLLSSTPVELDGVLSQHYSWEKVNWDGSQWMETVNMWYVWMHPSSSEQ